MNTLSEKEDACMTYCGPWTLQDGPEAFHLALLGSCLDVNAMWEGGYLTRIDLRLCGDACGTGAGCGLAFSRLRDILEAVLSGSVRCGSIPAKARGSKFQTKVWAALLSIPRGSVITYGQLADMIGCASPRAIGQALGANPLPIIIPCHRVVGADGLGGFSCGINVKRLLLRSEGIM